MTALSGMSRRAAASGRSNQRAVSGQIQDCQTNRLHLAVEIVEDPESVFEVAGFAERCDLALDGDGDHAGLASSARPKSAMPPEGPDDGN